MTMVQQVNRIDPLVSASRGSSGDFNSLAERLQEFYNTTQDYTSFYAPSNHGVWLRLVADEIETKFRRTRAKVRVLEVGAGRGSVFKEVENLDRSTFHYTAQDVTEIVSGHLKQVADAFHIGPLRILRGQFHVVFSLFVLEHVARPDEFLAEISNPKLVVIVGSLGLTSNIVGLFLFHGQ